MKKGIKSKSVSVFLTLMVIVTLVMLGPASAISLNLAAPNNAVQGQDVSFSVNMELNYPDQYLPIAFTEFVFTGPNGFQETCKVYNDGSYTDCSLDLDVDVIFNTGYGIGDRLSYGYGYNYGQNYQYFGYGYGYGYGNYENGSEATYNIIWHTPADANAGDYQVKARMHVVQADYYDQIPYDYCDVMFGMYQEWFYQVGSNMSYYDPELDLNVDGIVDLQDVGIFSQNNSADSVMYGRFEEFFRIPRENNNINSYLDVFPEDEGDGILSLSDVGVFSKRYYGEHNEAWCAVQLTGYNEKKYEIYESDKESFEITVPSQAQTSGGSSGRRSELTSDEEIIEINPVDEQNTEGNNVSGNGGSVNNEDSTNQEESTNILGAITGAVTGLGSVIGLGSTPSYLLAIFILLMIILVVSRKMKKN